MLHDAGYNVLAYDLRNHGLSGAANGGVVTHGFTESRDVVGSLEYIRSRPDTRDMAIGPVSYTHLMFYYESVRDDREVEAKLSSYVENKLLCNRGCPEYFKRMRREGIGWNPKRVERVYRKMGLSRRRKKKRCV